MLDDLDDLRVVVARHAHGLQVGVGHVAALADHLHGEAHGRVGYQTVQVDTPLGDVDDDGLAYGVGVGWNATNSIGIRADYTRMEGDLDTDAISLGASFNF